MYPDNNWYGHRSILAEYCCIKDTHVFASIQHGITPFWMPNELGRRKLNYTPYLCWDKNTELHCHQNGIKNVKAIGAPFIYLHKLYSKKVDISLKKRNVILFPSHSSISEKRNLNYCNLLIEYIEKKYKPPYTVCFYYKDLHKINKAFFLRKNWLIVCNGNRVNKSFLKNLYNNLINHNIVLCAELGSTMFYSLFLEKKTSLILKVKENSFYKEIENPKRGFDKEKYIKFMDRHNFLKNKGFIDKKLGKRLANKVLGLNNLKSKNELKAYLGWNNKIKIFLAKLFAKILDLKYPNKR
jgi:hypothetical protein